MNFRSTQSTIALLASRKYVNAMAVFRQKYGNKWETLQKNVTGILLQDGYFIFYVDNGMRRQLVLTTNTGHIDKSGYLFGKTDTWMEPDTWIKSTYYKIIDFQGIEGLYNYNYHFKLLSNMVETTISFFFNFCEISL